MKEKISQLEEELKSLDPVEQKQRVNEFLKTLSPEELNQMKENKCIFCSIANKEVVSKIIYEDEYFMGILDIRPANPGHVILFRKKHIKSLSEMSEEEIRNYFYIADKIRKSLIKNIKAQGVNILLSEGYVAGQKSEHLVIHIIPRFESDNINLEWNPKEIADDDLERIKNLIKVEKQQKKEIKSTESYSEIERIA